MTRGKILFTAAVTSLVMVLGIWSARSCSKTDTESLAGVDSNHDGVRDDVESFIHKNYSNEKVRIAAREYHRSLQQAILSPEKWDPSKGDIALDCLYYLDPEQASKIFHEIEAQTANTRARIQAYWKANARFSGTVVPGINPRKEACAFDKRFLEGK